MPDYVLIIIRSVAAFMLLLILTRVMGKKQLSHLTFFDYIVGITIGSIAATISLDPDIELTNAIISLAIWGTLPLILGFLGLKFRKFSLITDGKPSILIKRGKILEKSMKKNNIIIDELLMLLREKGVFKVDDVEMAVLETNGELSIMKKSDLEPITPRLLGMKVTLEQAPTLLIADGHILMNNLSTLGYSKKWLETEIQKQGVKSCQDVFLAQVDSRGQVYVDLYTDGHENNHD